MLLGTDDGSGVGPPVGGVDGAEEGSGLGSDDGKLEGTADGLSLGTPLRGSGASGAN